MTIVDNAFQPSTYRVAVGTTVDWVNTGAVPHTVTSSSGGFDSGFLLTGDTYRRTFNANGTYDYICTLHPGMTGRVIVGSGGTPPPPATPPVPVVPPTVPPVGPSDVAIVDNAYDPGNLSVSVGQAITWVNTGALPHTVTAVDGAYDSSIMMPGETFQLSFGAPGTYDYICTIHPGMAGVVLVTGEGTGGPAIVTTPDPGTATSSSGGAPPPVDAAAAAESPSVQRAIKSVRVIDNAFEPGDIQAETGQTIRWSNAGVLPHTVTAQDQSFDSGILEKGAEFRMSFDTAGIYAYVCSLHPEMVGTITVVDAPVAVAASVVPIDGTEDVPISVAIMLGMAIVAAMGIFAFGMIRFAKAADQQRGVARRVA